jgi:glycosyltransferase involved in cell wall biosynthesis
VKRDAKSLKKEENPEVVILAVGRLSRHKGQMWLVKVFQKLCRISSLPLKLVLVGKDEGEGKLISKFIQKSNLSNKVILTGEISDHELNNWYYQADIFALFPKY